MHYYYLHAFALFSPRICPRIPKRKRPRSGESKNEFLQPIQESLERAVFVGENFSNACPSYDPANQPHGYGVANLHMAPAANAVPPALPAAPPASKKEDPIEEALKRAIFVEAKALEDWETGESFERAVFAAALE